MPNAARPKRRQFHPFRIEVGIEDEEQPFNAEIGSILAGVELIAKRSQTRIRPFRAIQVRPKPGKVRHLIVVEVFAEEELRMLQKREATSKRGCLAEEFEDIVVPRQRRPVK